MAYSKTERGDSRTELSAGQFLSSHLLSSLEQLPKPARYLVGFSGGADSTALLCALLELQDRLPAPFSAVHFNHGLHNEANVWLKYCEQFCLERGVPLTTRKLSIKPGRRTSLEEEARNCRYRALAGLLNPGDMYLTAHHADDQAETLFLNLMRGSGIEGLAGIPELRSLDAAWVARPLLDVRRKSLESYLIEKGISWLEDPSNDDEVFDRNYLRLKLFPELEIRWPQITQRLTRTARHARTVSAALAGFLEQQLGELMGDELKLALGSLLELDRPMQSLVLRHWLRGHEVPALSEVRIHEFLDQLASSSDSSQPEVHWATWKMKRYRNWIWLQHEPFPGSCDSADWREGNEMELGNGLGRLVLVGEPCSVPAAWNVDQRRPSASIRTHPKRRRQSIKKLFAESGIPPWLRPSVPVLYWDGKPAAVGDWIISHRLRKWLTVRGLEYHWRPDDAVLARLRSDCRHYVVDHQQTVG